MLIVIYTYSPIALANISSINLVFIFRCSSSPRNPVYVRRIDSSTLVFSLSWHRHSYRSNLYLSLYRFIIIKGFILPHNQWWKKWCGVWCLTRLSRRHRICRRNINRNRLSLSLRNRTIIETVVDVFPWKVGDLWFPPPFFSTTPETSKFSGMEGTRQEEREGVVLIVFW
jgi:hypothetical protein